jgi:solute:Na+ symporter, SSS family
VSTPGPSATLRQQENTMEDMGLQWAVIAAYVGFIFIKGVLKGRQIEHSDDYLLAGRNVGWLLLFTTLGATVIGGGYSVGAVARTYEWGLLMVLVSVGGYLHFVFSGLVVAPRFREAKLYTVAGYFKLRYDERTRRTVLVLSLAFSVFIVAAQIAAIGSVLASLLGEAVADPWILTWAILVGGAVVIIYSTAGGLLAVIHTDVYQFVVLFAGFLLTVALLAPQLIGHWGEIRTVLPADFFTIDGGKGWLFLVTTFLAFLLGETFAPGYATRYCIGKNITQTKIGIAGVGVVLSAVFPVIILVIALFARWQFPDIEPQYALALVIGELHNPWVGGLMIAALLSAVMSSADSALSSATTIFVKDLLEDELGRTDIPDRRRIRIARTLTVVLGLVSTAIAVLWPDIIDLLLFTYHIWAPGIILPVVVGVLSRRRDGAQNRAIFWTMLVSVAVALAWRATPWADIADPAVVGVGFSILAYLALLRRAE